jgi:AcrR family transcriptional regulator
MTIMPPLPPSARPLRADARRNRDAILNAARAAFGRDGFDAQIDDIARDAGVGVGTIYRHFPTKEALIDALALAHFEGLAELANAALAKAEAGADPWTTFTDLMWACARRQADDAGLSEIVETRPETINECAAEITGLQAASGRLMTLAIEAGELRADATVTDIPLMMKGLGKMLTESAVAMGLTWERYMTLMLDGLRAR